MKKELLIAAIVITVFGLTSFAFIHNQKGVIISDVEQQDSLTSQTDQYVFNFTEDYSELEKPPNDLVYQYFVRGNYKTPIKKEKLNNIRLISDVIPFYPTKWITDYTSVEVLIRDNGKEMKAVSPNDVLSPEQKNLFNSCELADDIEISVKYKAKNAVTNNMDDREMNISLTVIPEVEAEYIGGYDRMMGYLMANSKDKIDTRKSDEFNIAFILFTINEEGGIENVKLTETCGNDEIDKLLLDLINTMPKWKPAENANGTTVKQEFEFTVGMGMGC